MFICWIPFGRLDSTRPHCFLLRASAARPDAGYAGAMYSAHDKWLEVQKELVVGREPMDTMAFVKPEAIERDRQPEAARRAARAP